MDEWIGACMNEPTDERMDGRMDWRTDRQTDEWVSNYRALISVKKSDTIFWLATQSQVNMNDLKSCLERKLKKIKKIKKNKKMKTSNQKKRLGDVVARWQAVSGCLWFRWRTPFIEPGGGVMREIQSCCSYLRHSLPSRRGVCCLSRRGQRKFRPLSVKEVELFASGMRYSVICKLFDEQRDDCETSDNVFCLWCVIFSH